MTFFGDLQIQRILNCATELTRDEREYAICLEIRKLGAEEHFRNALAAATGCDTLAEIPEDGFNSAAVFAWKFIYLLRKAGQGTVH